MKSSMFPVKFFTLFLLALNLTASADQHESEEANEGAEEVILQTGGEQAPPATGIDNPAALEAFMDGVAKSLMRTNGSPAGTVAVMKDGELVLARGYGFQDIENQVPVDPHTTLVRPGSVSKLFTWVAVMQQVERGNLDLDADVNTYLENFQIRDTFEQPITLWNILTHTPGFEDGAVGYLIIDDIEKAYPLSESMPRYQPMRVNPPGAQTSYSNYATALAGLIVENVSGVPFNDYLEQNIFEPLGMHSSTFKEPLPEELAGNMAGNYSLEAGAFSDNPFEIITSFGPAGAMSSTATDMVRFGQAMLNGGELDGNRILREETVAQMLSQQFSHDERLKGMGLGFYATDVNGTEVWGHGGDTIYFHSYLGIDKAHDLTYFWSFASNGGGTVRTALGYALYDGFFPREEPAPEPPGDFAERAGKYAGTYGFWRSNFSTIEKALGLAGGVTIAPTENNTLMVVVGDNAKQYAEIDTNLFRELNPNVKILGAFSPRLMAFQENEAGEVTGAVMDGLPFMSMRKLKPWETANFNYMLLGISMLLFLGVLLRRFYQRSAIRAMPAADRSAINAAVYVSAANWLTAISCVVVLSAVGDSLFGGIHVAVKVWLVLPVLATLAGLYMLFRTFGVWTGGLLAGTWARVRYTLVMLGGLFMCWFYWFWNILGWQYLQ